MIVPTPGTRGRAFKDGANLLKAAAIYFFVVFGAGLVLGTVRVLLIVPLIGTRAAELSESPLMLAATILTAGWVVRRFCDGLQKTQLLGVGFIAVALVLLADMIVGLGLRGMSLAQVFSERDAVSGLVYYALLALFAFMPWFLGRQPRPVSRHVS